MRVEPKLAPPGSRKPTYDDLRALAALYERPAARKPRKPMTLAGIIAMIFVVGTTVGFGVASLLGGEKSVDVRFPYSHGTRAFPDRGNGISSGELPYDGKTIDPSPGHAQETSSGFNAAELPYGGNSSGIGTQEREPAATPVPSKSETPSIEPKETEDPPPAAQAPKPAKQNASRKENKAVTQPQRHKQVHRADKDREIERIRQQAAEELKKKTDAGQPVAESRGSNRKAGQRNGRREGATRTARASTMTGMLQQCEQAGNFILREQCRWQLCGGKWGKSGCPSYPPRANQY